MSIAYVLAEAATQPVIKVSVDISVLTWVSLIAGILSIAVSLLAIWLALRFQGRAQEASRASATTLVRVESEVRTLRVDIAKPFALQSERIIEMARDRAIDTKALEDALGKALDKRQLGTPAMSAVDRQAVVKETVAEAVEATSGADTMGLAPPDRTIIEYLWVALGSLGEKAHMRDLIHVCRSWYGMSPTAAKTGISYLVTQGIFQADGRMPQPDTILQRVGGLDRASTGMPPSADPLNNAED